MKAFKRKNVVDVEFVKRYDQNLNQIFRDLPADLQEGNDITTLALKNIV